MNIEFTPFPQLKTSRLLLRRLLMTDAEPLFKLRSDDSVNRYLGRPKSTGTEEAISFIKKIDDNLAKNKSVYWVLGLKDNNEFIGTICLWNFNIEREMADLGYELMPEYQGQGFMLEAAEKVVEYGFDVIGLKLILGVTHPENKVSQRLLEKMGFMPDEDGVYVSKEEADGEAVYYLINN